MVNRLRTVVLAMMGLAIMAIANLARRAREEFSRAQQQDHAKAAKITPPTQCIKTPLRSIPGIRRSRRVESIAAFAAGKASGDCNCGHITP